jgi:hypothetical protein
MTYTAGLPHICCMYELSFDPALEARLQIVAFTSLANAMLHLVALHCRAGALHQRTSIFLCTRLMHALARTVRHRPMHMMGV